MLRMRHRQRNSEGGTPLTRRQYVCRLRLCIAYAAFDDTEAGSPETRARAPALEHLVARHEVHSEPAPVSRDADHAYSAAERDGECAVDGLFVIRGTSLHCHGGLVRAGNRPRGLVR